MQKYVTPKNIVIALGILVAFTILIHNPAAQVPKAQNDVVSELADEIKNFATSINQNPSDVSLTTPTKTISSADNQTEEIISDSISFNDTSTYLVTRVIDGDTIDVEIAGVIKRVRYIGIDTPETVHPDKPVQCFGAEASAYNKQLVAGQRVRLESDISDTDKYGRLLRYVYLGETMVNLTLISDGYATLLTYPPDVKHNELFKAAQTQARESGNGLWGESCMEVATSNAAVVTLSTPASPAAGGACAIKGNISSDEEKIFHTPGCNSYDKTIISEEKGEQWFCSEAEAVQAGWRKAKNC